MKVLRGVRRVIGLTLTVVPLSLIGTAIALGWTPPGRHFAGRLVEQMLNDKFNGAVSIGSIDGDLIHRIDLGRVAIHDSTGRAMLVATRIQASYNVFAVIRGEELFFHDVIIDTATIHIVKGKSDIWNYQSVFSSKTGDSTGAPKHVMLTGVTLHQVTLRVDMAEKHRPIPPVRLRNAKAPIPPHIEDTPEGLLRTRILTGMNARFDTIRVSTPKRDPLRLRIASLSAKLNDPAVTISNIQGTVLTASDSLLFDLKQVALPHSMLHGKGSVHWPHGPAMFDFVLTADTVALADLLWISPDFPDWQGKGRVVATSQGEDRTSYRLDPIRLGDAQSQAVGKMTAVVDENRGLGMKDLDLALSNVPLAIMRPYLDTLPFAGTLNGRLTADGFFDGMMLGGDLLFTDALVESAPKSHFLIDGLVHFGGKDGAVFEEFRMNGSTIDLATVRRMVPSVVLPGTLTLTGRLDGAWTNVLFDGVTEHLAPDQSRSRMVGAVQLNTRDTLLRIGVDADVDQLSFDALRSGYPTLKPRGGLTGHILARGRLDSLMVDANLSGEIGTFHATGHLNANSPNFGSDSLFVDFARINSDALLANGYSTAFNGHAYLRGLLDSTGVRFGSVSMVLDKSRFEALSFEGAQIRLHADSGLVFIDTLQADLPEGYADVRGNLGLDSLHRGKLIADIGFSSLTPFDSLFRALTKLTADTVKPRLLNGTIQGLFTVTGSVKDPSINGQVQAKNLVVDQWRIAHIVADVGADSLGGRGLVISADGDSLGHAEQLLERTKLRLSGRKDSLRVAIDGRMYRSAFASLFTWMQKDSNGTGRIDSLVLNNPEQKLRLTAPARVAYRQGQFIFADTAKFQAVDGSGALTLSGAVPGTSAGDLAVSAVGLNIHEYVSLFKRDSIDIFGRASFDFHLGGTAAAPTLRGSTAFTGLKIGESQVPLARAAFDYSNQRLRSLVTFYKAGDPLLQANLSLPYDLAFSPKGSRQLPGEIDITATADSSDLGLLEAFTAAVRDAKGSLSLNMHAGGTWLAPRFTGTASIDRGSMTLPDLGVIYSGIEAKLRFSGDSLLMDTVRVNSGDGSVDMSGSIRFDKLTTPILTLDLRPRDFLFMDVPGLMTLRPSGTLKLTGPMLKPLLTGNLELSRSIVYFDDLVTKNYINLEDPEYADLVDTATIHRRGLGSTLQSRFLDSLRIVNLSFTAKEDVTLKSAQANIVLTSEEPVRVNKLGKTYTVDGGFTVSRGSYTLSLQNLVTKTFNIESGTVNFFGTTDLNADVNLVATHTLRTQEGDELPLVARVTGEIRKPEITLESPGHSLAQRDIVSYLIFGQPSAQVTANAKAAEILYNATASSLVSSTLNQAIAKNLTSSTDIEITSAPIFGSNQGSVAVRQELGSRVQLSLNGSFCKTTNKAGFGGSAEYRLGGGFRIQTSYLPIQSCLNTESSDILRSTVKYQFGGALLWKREY